MMPMVVSPTPCGVWCVQKGAKKQNEGLCGRCEQLEAWQKLLWESHIFRLI